MDTPPLAEQIAAVLQAAKAERHAAARTVYPAERALMLRRASALDAAATTLRTVAASRNRRRSGGAR